MYGTNPIRKSETDLDGQTLAVQEIFHTIQGEGPQSGRPCTFIRLAGCNLACTFCDTEFESGINNRLTVEQIVKMVASFPNHRLVVLTGGEPMRQNIIPLIAELLSAGVEDVQIETAGTLWLERSDPNRGTLAGWINDGAVELVCSPKTPSVHPMIVRWCKHYKYIIESGKLDPVDGLPAWGTQPNNSDKPQRLFRPWDDDGIAYRDRHAGLTVWVSPCDPNRNLSAFGRMLDAADNQKAAVASALQFGYRLSLQIHKIVNLP